MSVDSGAVPEISELVPEDLDNLLAIEQKAYSIPWTRGNLKDSLLGGHLGLSCRQEGVVVGYAFMMKALDEMHLLNFTIDPDHQGKGWGRYLLAAVKSRAREMNCQRLLLEVRQSNVRAIRLYRADGFTQIGLRRQYYPCPHGREDAIVMSRTL